MLKKITIMNRREAMKYTRRQHVNEKSAMLSICSSDMNYTSSPKSCSHVPILKTSMFDDVLPGEDGCAMTKGQAEDVAAFVRRVAEMKFVTQLIVHCDEGISRSAAVAKAVAEAFGLPKEAVSHNREPNPNEHVYSLMKEALS